MPDTSAITSALVAKLGSDTTLLGLMPNGVYRNVAPPGATRFVLVTLILGEDQGALEGRSFEDLTYRVTAVGLSTTTPNMAGAAARINAILEGQTLDAPGYTFMAMRRLRPFDQDEIDDLDRSIQWAHRGGEYQVVMSL